MDNNKHSPIARSTVTQFVRQREKINRAQRVTNVNAVKIYVLHKHRVNRNYRSLHFKI